MRAIQCAGECRVARRRYRLAIVECDQVDVLAEPPLRLVRACQRGTADELDLVLNACTEEGEHVGDVVIPLDLIAGGAELCCD